MWPLPRIGPLVRREGMTEEPAALTIAWLAVVVLHQAVTVLTGAASEAQTAGHLSGGGMNPIAAEAPGTILAFAGTILVTGTALVEARVEARDHVTVAMIVRTVDILATPVMLVTFVVDRTIVTDEAVTRIGLVAQIAGAKSVAGAAVVGTGRPAKASGSSPDQSLGVGRSTHPRRRRLREQSEASEASGIEQIYLARSQYGRLRRIHLGRALDQ